MSTYTFPIRALFALLLSLLLALPAAAQAPRKGLLTPLSPQNSVLLLVDIQPQFMFSVTSIDAQTLINNATGITKAAKAFGIPTVLATINAESFGGPFIESVTRVHGQAPLDRTAINAWDDARVRDRIRASGKRKLLIGGLWTDSCVVLPALSALAEDFEVYVITDVAGDVNPDSHHHAIQRLVQAGATPVSWLAVLLEWQRDWANTATTAAVLQIAREHGGAWGVGISYAGSMGVGRK